jgi:hypothetical protein
MANLIYLKSFFLFSIVTWKSNHEYDRQNKEYLKKNSRDYRCRNDAKINQIVIRINFHAYRSGNIIYSLPQ